MVIGLGRGNGWLWVALDFWEVGSRRLCYGLCELGILYRVCWGRRDLFVLGSCLGTGATICI